ncbi:hypothetical protein DERF_006624 [Dermatophagoides farinae]|uniref:Uncharacterized protein n=1 Tax=Dermatophagoides farinae TaxID=6954 RepID=A0A922HYX5_DERFA|nr:hypothetical protein DERF_006624 [Dermatophagoides farinae]
MKKCIHIVCIHELYSVTIWNMFINLILFITGSFAIINSYPYYVHCKLFIFLCQNISSSIKLHWCRYIIGE